MSEKAPPPTPLSSPTRLIVALAAVSASANDQQWLQAVCKQLDLDPSNLPNVIDAERVEASASEQRDEWTVPERKRIASVLLEASLASEAEKSKLSGEKKDKKEKDAAAAAAGALKYTPTARAHTHRVLNLLGLDPETSLPIAEKDLSETLFKAMKDAESATGVDSQGKVESTRAKHAEGWGGSFGRKLATGAGVIAGGVLLGVTGGLAAPAIAAVLAPLGIGGILSAGAAPVVLGTLFGVGGGGLAGRRVRERWRGVEEFSFVEVGAGTKMTMEEAEELKMARERYKARVKKRRRGSTETDSTAVDASSASAGGTAATEAKGEKEAITEPTRVQEEKKQASTEEQVEAGRAELEEKLLNLSLTSPTSPRTSLSGDRPRLDSPTDETDIKAAPHAPSLTATIVVPGLLTVSRTEAITAWRSICSDKPSSSPFGGKLNNAPSSPSVTAGADGGAASGAGSADVDVGVDVAKLQLRDDTDATTTTTIVQTPNAPSPLSDGRDVYLLRFESAMMLKAGREIDHWVTSKLKGKIQSEIIKRTLLNAYFAAVSLPMTVYSMASMSLDNTWMQAQDRASKAGRVLGEVLEQRVQGERPVILIGSSLGALTILKALLYLSTLPPPAGSTPGTRSSAAHYVESAYLISLPSAPTSEEWASCRKVVARRLVNAYSGADWVLAGVVRLHEVISRAATLNSGVSPAGLAPVEQAGVENVDLGEVLHGHMELQAKMGDIMRIIKVDA